MVLSKKDPNTFDGLIENVTDEVITEYSILETTEDKIIFIEKLLGLKPKDL